MDLTHADDNGYLLAALTMVATIAPTTIAPVTAVMTLVAFSLNSKARLGVAQGQQAKSLELRATVNLSRLWRRQGKRREARDLLMPTHSFFVPGFDTPDLRAATALLEELLDRTTAAR